MPTSDSDYKKLLSEIIKKQMMVLGPDITLNKVKSVPGLTVDQNGDVVDISGDPTTIMQQIINQFVELSGLIVKKTMESILTTYPSMVGFASQSAFGTTASTAATNVPQQSQAQVSTQSVSPQPNTLRTDTVVVAKEVAPVEEKKVEPPSITETTQSQPQLTPDKPKEFTSSELENLNKALEELSNTPLSTETAQNQPASQSVS